MTAREELHRLIDTLSDEEAAALLEHARGIGGRQTAEDYVLPWVAQANVMSDIAQRGTVFPSSADTINELREDGDEEIMGALRGNPALQE